MIKHIFPFNAVVGQEQAKLALTLAAIDPKIGGVLISGPRGTAKSTLARGFAQVLPQNVSGDRPFVNMPLGTAEDRLLGSLDLEKVIENGQVDFKPGLLSDAHTGVLYVDEVNLLPDHLVDHLLDVSASGINRLERDGVSHEHAAEFLLIGTMNPDEGEIRPQLLDRFGLTVEVSDQFSIEERIQAVKIRELFDGQPEEFISKFEEFDQQYSARMAQAQANLPVIEISDSLRVLIAERCVAAGVDGLRADIVWSKAALAHAAWRGAVVVEVEDLDAVEELVLRSRRNVSDNNGASDSGGEGQKSDSTSQSNSQSQSPFKRPEQSYKQEALNSAESTSNQNGPSEQSDWGQMNAQHAPTIRHMQHDFLGEIEELLTAQIGDFVRKINLEPAKNVSLKRAQSSQANLISRESSGNQKMRKGAIDWFGSLLASNGTWPPQAFRFQSRRKGIKVVHQVLIDTSASGFQAEALSTALGFVKTLAKDAYLKREGIRLIGFGNDEVTSLGDYHRSPKNIDSVLERIETGGGTPLYEAVQHLKSATDRLLRKHPELRVISYILSDGRSRSSLSGIDLEGETVWIDTEESKVQRGRGKQFALDLGAVYLSLFAGKTA